MIISSSNSPLMPYSSTLDSRMEKTLSWQIAFECSHIDHILWVQVGPATMIKRFPLVIATQYNIPMILDCEGTGHQVQGEVYKIDQRMLEHLDVLEAHPRLYSRGVHQIQVGVNTLSCWVYIVQGYKWGFDSEKLMLLKICKIYRIFFLFSPQERVFKAPLP